MTTEPSPRDVIRVLLKLTIVAVAAAGVVGVVGLLAGDMDDRGWRVLATSATFGLACTVAAAGVDVARRPVRGARGLGRLTIALVAAAFALFMFVLWTEIDSEPLGKLPGTLAILALEAGHASFVVARRRLDDRDGIRLIAGVSLVATALSAAAGISVVWGDWDGEVAARLIGVLLIVQLVTAIVPSLLRRVQQRASRSPGLADELDAIADRLERATTAGAARHEVRRLRELAAASRD